VKISCISESGISEEVVLSDTIFGRAYNESLVHQIVNSYMANGRAGTRAQKGRSEVSKTTRKQWRQKGTGRARAGAASNPIWRGGGNIFPNRPDEKFSQKVNRKMYRAGICTILSQLLRDNRLQIVDEFIVDTPKTKDFLQKLQKHKLKNAMIITDVVDDNLYLASRNVPNVKVVEFAGMDPVSLLHYENVIMTRKTIGKFESALL
jgi:large subunit ribosomal protein L4